MKSSKAFQGVIATRALAESSFGQRLDKPQLAALRRGYEVAGERFSRRTCGNGIVPKAAWSISRGPLGSMVLTPAQRMRCGSAWCCYSCASAAARLRALRLEAGLRAAIDAGFVVRTGVLSWSHSANVPLRDEIDSALEAWSYATGRGTPARRLEEAGFEWATRSLEVTCGAYGLGRGNGWHVHIHVVLVTKAYASESVWSTLRESFHRKNGKPWLPQFNDSEPIRDLGDLARYVGKGANLLEWTSSSVGNKTGSGNLGMSEVLSLAGEGRPDAISAWREYESATYKRRAWGVVGGRGLPKLVTAILRDLGESVKLEAWGLPEFRAVVQRVIPMPATIDGVAQWWYYANSAGRSGSIATDESNDADSRIVRTEARRRRVLEAVHDPKEERVWDGWQALNEQAESLRGPGFRRYLFDTARA